jgi:hypothetical protein
MLAAAERLLAPQFRAVARLMTEPVLQPIYDLETPRMAFGPRRDHRRRRVRGAAACRRPGCQSRRRRGCAGAGAGRGRCRAGAHAFEASALPVGRRIIERARHLGAYLQATQTAEERARSQRHSIPQAVLAETAVLDFLYA